MPRSYGQHCALAKSLDLVGDRWTLLIVRELLDRPRRYGLVVKRELPKPASGKVYDLTGDGRARCAPMCATTAPVLMW
ncbi:hypothetical protein MDOR_27850 [Mycolicibacterium doricum]|uniref:HTH hxlR-type domain-containing protein n=1 Tax=Mycolicibacterium doricum TaxID=126673 RepID=A0A7I7VTJ5_9MYCO|nr:hypothetical protein [Mycolicibacterium doricum]BBZ08616.1 hypothetical protein MDOR_27850 [Mycolicibacterium doricum]